MNRLVKCPKCGNGQWNVDKVKNQKVCRICGFIRPIEEWVFVVNRLTKVSDTVKPKANLVEAGFQKNIIFKILRETVLGYVKIYGKEKILPFIEKIYQEAKNTRVEEYFI